LFYQTVDFCLNVGLDRQRFFNGLPQLFGQTSDFSSRQFVSFLIQNIFPVRAK
jgi:hypothetical protein